jgi:hypothetical protein
MGKMLVVKESEIHEAVERANALFDEWQARAIEVILIPHVYVYWCGIQRSPWRIERVPGKEYKAHTREQNLEIGERNGWGEYAGYHVYRDFGEVQLPWNGIRDDWYSHSAGTAWDGLRRETICEFAYELSSAYTMKMDGRDYHYLTERLDNKGILLVWGQ